MKAKVIRKDKHWEIHLYNSLDELVERIYVEELVLPKYKHLKEECHV